MIAPRFLKIAVSGLALDAYVPPNTGLEADRIPVRTTGGMPLVVTGPRSRVVMIDTQANKLLFEPLDFQFRDWFNPVQEQIIDMMQSWEDSAYTLNNVNDKYFDVHIGKFIGFRRSQQFDYSPIITDFVNDDSTPFKWQDISVGDEITPILRISAFFHDIYPSPPLHADPPRTLKGVVMEMLRAIVYPKPSTDDPTEWQFDLIEE
jgi:hypothetical protein